MTYRELLRWGEEALAGAAVPDGATDAWSLMEFVFEIEKGYYFLHGNDKINRSLQERYEELIRKRCQRIPLQQLTGTAWFMGYPFHVTDQVLTPRFDTEILVDEAQKLLRQGDRILDVCTGSGCILLSLLAAHEKLQLQGTGVDLSEEALKVAEENAKRLQVEARLLKSDLFAAVEGSYDLILSNPPYIATEVIDGLMPEVREHEPRMALDGGADGLDFYRKIAGQAGDYLVSGGWLGFEIGYDQGEALKEILTREGYRNVRIGKDLAGLDRTAWGQKENWEDKNV